MELCQKCGKNLALVGRVHNCVPITKEIVNAGYKKAVEEIRKTFADPPIVSDKCPICEARRLKQIEAQKRWRAKKITKKI